MKVWLEIEGKKQVVEIRSASDTMECLVDGRAMEVDGRLMQAGVLSLIVEGRQYRCVMDGDAVVIAGRRFAFSVEDPRSLQGRRGVGADTGGPRVVKSPMPGRVVRVLVNAGDEVEEGQAVVAIEAMKMQNDLKSPKKGRVVRISVAIGDTVSTGDVMVVVD